LNLCRRDVVTAIRHGERSVAIHACEFGLMDCRAELAVTKFVMVHSVM